MISNRLHWILFLAEWSYNMQDAWPGIAAAFMHTWHKFHCFVPLHHVLDPHLGSGRECLQVVYVIEPDDPTLKKWSALSDGSCGSRSCTAWRRARMTAIRHRSLFDTVRHLHCKEWPND